MPTKNAQYKPVFKLVIWQGSILLQVPIPKRNTLKLMVLVILLCIVIVTAVIEHDLRVRALELIISIIEAILTFLSAGSKIG